MIEEKCQKNTSNHRLCMTQYMGLMTKFKEAIHAFYQMQVTYREKQQRRFERQYRIVQPDATDDEIERVLSSEFSGPIFGQSVRKIVTYFNY